MAGMLSQACAALQPGLLSHLPLGKIVVALPIWRNLESTNATTIIHTTALGLLVACVVERRLLLLKFIEGRMLSVQRTRQEPVVRSERYFYGREFCDCDDLGADRVCGV